jgi:glycosyltransferase involved in cell wall biosynthesis
MSSKSILVISHTEHFLDADGVPHGWRSTVNELDFIASQGYNITHLAVLHPGLPSPSTARYTQSNVQFVALPPFGGPGFISKLKIAWSTCVLLVKVFQLLPKHDRFQFRAPTSIGVVLIPFLTLFTKKKGWYKYAGNWGQPNMPWSYRIQKSMLSNWQKRPVTINGRWPNQPTHCYSFENPCFRETELEVLRPMALQKDFSGKWDFVFIGRLDESKGVDRLLAWTAGAVHEKVGTLHLIGDSDLRDSFEQYAKANSNIPVVFHGFQSRERVFQLLIQSHFLVLPSLSEGFPKVVAEAAACGCIPIVSDVSALSQYIAPEIGYLYPLGHDFKMFMSKVEIASSFKLKSQSLEALQMAHNFTFERYLKRLTDEIF